MVAPTTIKEHMEVIGSDGVHVGIVDGLEGRDQVKLTKDDADAGGETEVHCLAQFPRDCRVGREVKRHYVRRDVLEFDEFVE